MKIITFIALLLIVGCSSNTKINNSGWPITGNRGIDMALENPALSYETKANIMRAHLGQPPVYKKPRNTSSYRPVIDPSICKDCDYEKDVTACQSIASSNTNYAANTLAGAAVGAGIGALLGAATGLNAGTVAAGGAVGGAAGGLSGEMSSVNTMIIRCMKGRGYSVLR